MALLSLQREAEESFRRDRFSSLVLLISFLSLLLQASLILVSWGKLPPQVPLFYSRPWGELLLATPAQLWMLPGILLLVLIINYVFAIFFASSERFLVRAILIFSLVLAVTTLYDVVKIISLLT